MSYYTSKLKLHTTHAYDNSHDRLPPYMRENPKKVIQRSSSSSSTDSNTNKRQRTDAGARRTTAQQARQIEQIAAPVRRITTARTPEAGVTAAAPATASSTADSTATTPAITPTKATAAAPVNIAERSITAIANILTAYSEQHSTSQQHTPQSIQSIASDIEAELSKRHTDDKQAYRQHVRDICMNLKQNINLRYELLNSYMTAHQLVNTDSAELATAELKQKRNELNELSLKIRQSADIPQQLVDDVKCSKCGHMGAYMTQSNVALTNKSDTWGSKDLDATSNYTCAACGYKWQKLLV